LHRDHVYSSVRLLQEREGLFIAVDFKQCLLCDWLQLRHTVNRVEWRPAPLFEDDWVLTERS